MDIEDLKIELNQLELKIESLVAMNQRLREENSGLKAQIEEIESTHHKHCDEKAIVVKSWIDSMLSRLKSTGHES